MNKDNYIQMFRQISDKKQLKTLNNSIKCNNDNLIFTQEAYSKQENDIIPIFYDSNVWMCFTFKEIFEDLYNLIKANKLPFIPDPLFPQKTLDAEKSNLILEFDKKFNGGSIKKLLESNTSVIKSYQPEGKTGYSFRDMLAKKSLSRFSQPSEKITDENLNTLKKIREQLIKKKDIEGVISILFEWLYSLGSQRLIIENYKVYVDGRYIAFKNVLETCKTLDFCISSLIAAIDDILKNEIKSKPISSQVSALGAIVEDD